MGTIGKFKWNFTILLFTIALCASQCPDHKPFASETGCVSGCPEPFYIRNTTCVFDCGNDFVDETNHCVPSCPDGYLYRETLKTSGKGMFIEKMCIVYCYDEVISNTECIKRCPPSQMYLDIEDYHQRCISICPARKPFLINITFQGINYMQCESKCEAYILDGYCVPNCPIEMVHLNKTCIDSCPDSHSVVSNGQCFQECNEHSIHLGCKCPEDRPFIGIRTCLTNCSDLISSSSQRFCDESCFPGMLSEKNSQGNYKYINRSMCVESCSDEQAFLCRSLYLNCLPDLIDRELTFCVQTCPLFSFVSGSKCIEYCSDRQYVRNNSCVDNCSSLEYIQRKKYSKFYREGFECVNECSPEFVLFNKTCVDKCPAESPLSLNRTCVKVCPPDQNVKLVVTPRVTCNISEPDCGWIPKAEYFEYLVCKDSCPENEFLLNETCQASCPYTFKSWNGSCLRTCPASVPFLQPEGLFIQYRSWVQSNRWDGYYPLKVGFSFKTTALIVDTCVDTCSEPFEFHDAQLLQCLSGCLNERPFVLETNDALFCVQQCPPYLSLRAHVTKEVSSKTYARTRNIIACRSHCPDQTFYFNGSCLPSCPSEAIHVREGKCVGCDKFTLHGDQYAYCVDDCPTSFINGKTCVDECPKEKGFVINKHCSKCPEEAPFQLDVIFGEDKCVKSCKEDDKLADFSCENCEDTVNAKCIYSFECNEPDMINYDGMCLKYCPDGYVFLWIGCIWNIIPLIIVVLAGVLSISIGIFSRIVIMEYFVFVHYCFSIPKEIKYVLNQNVDILLDQQQGLDNEGFETRL